MCYTAGTSGTSSFCDGDTCAADKDCVTGTCVGLKCKACDNTAGPGNSMYCDKTVCT